jgi:Permease MlaE
VIWGLAFIIGLQCGIEGGYLLRAQGAPAYAGVFPAWCDLRELVPYAFGYMMAAKVGTGIVAELGAMRISDEIDALEVMGVPPVTFLGATRLLAAWIVLPFMYPGAIGVSYLASWIAVVEQIGDVSSGGYFLIFWMFQNPPDPLIQPDQGDVDGYRDRAGWVLLRLHRARGTGRRRHRDRQVDVPQHHSGPHHWHARHPRLLGRQPTRPHRRLGGPLALMERPGCSPGRTTPLADLLSANCRSRAPAS